MTDEKRFDQAAFLHTRAKQASRLIGGLQIDALPPELQAIYESTARRLAAILVATDKITAPNCPQCSRQMDPDLACCGFKTVHVEAE